MKKFLTFVAVLMIGTGLMAQDMMMDDGGNDIWVSGGAGLGIPVGRALSNTVDMGFSFYVSGEYTNLMELGPLSLNAGAELGLQSFSKEENGGTTTLNNIPINVFGTTSLGGMIGMPEGLDLKAGLGVGLFNTSTKVEENGSTPEDESEMSFGLYVPVGVTYSISPEMRVSGQVRAYEILGMVNSDATQDFLNIHFTFDYMLPM